MIYNKKQKDDMKTFAMIIMLPLFIILLPVFIIMAISGINDQSISKWFFN